MPVRRWLRSLVTSATVSLLWPAAAGAQPSRTSQPRIVMPVALSVPTVHLTDQALAAGVREVTVVLVTTVDDRGHVIAAEVTEPAGYGLDALAREALLDAKFEPAQRDGVAIVAKVRFAFRIVAEPPTPSAPASRQAPNAPKGDRPPIKRTSPREASDRVIDVTVEGESDAERLRRSAQAVTVLELHEARRETADLGEVLARTQGVGVRRGGGLGSDTRFSLNGLTNDQIRFFLDGVPLRYAGFPSGVANIPVNLFDRVDIYRGVVPIAFGADALGGAVNIVTDPPPQGAGVLASYQTGSFGTLRATLGGYYADRSTGLYTRLEGYHDEADNDYPIDVEVPDERGRLSPATVYRFHDRYLSQGGSLEVGVRDREWAERLSLRGFYSRLQRDLQHNVVMTVPYGEVRSRAATAGASLRYAVDVTDQLRVDLLTSYAYLRTGYIDVGACVYDWFGRCIRERAVAGERDSIPTDRVQDDHNLYARVNFAYEALPWLTVEASAAPSFFTRAGDERRQTDPDARDPLSAQRDVGGVVAGLSGTVSGLDDQLENITFAKLYYQGLSSEKPQPGGAFSRNDRSTVTAGAGNAFRYRAIDGLAFKASYEYATRLPNPEEVFGDGVQVDENLELEPEVSHNLNLGVEGNVDDTEAGDFQGTAYGFLREVDNLIVLLGNDRVFSYQNVFGARSVGVEGSLGWASPGDWVVLRGNATYQDFRNVADDGAFRDFSGDRIPNRPYLFANATGRVQGHDLFFAYDRLSLGYDMRFVASFFRSWESAGDPNLKQTIDDQLTHAARLQYVYREPSTVEASGTLEVQNLTDARVFDFFGVQRPGRAFYFKGTLAWEAVP